MGVSSSESHDLTAFYEMLSASFGVLSQNTGFYPSLDRIIETTLGPLNLGPGGGSYNEPISCLQWTDSSVGQILSEECVKLFLFCRGEGERPPSGEFGIRMKLYGMVPCLTRGEMGK